MKNTFGKEMNRFLTEIFNNILAYEQKCINESKINLTISEIHIIEQIGISGSKKMTDAAEAMGITLATMTAAADRLEKKGCIVRERSSADRRIVLLSLTRHGSAVFRLHNRFHERMVDKVSEEFDEKELELLSGALYKLNEFFKRKNAS